jgi:peptidyl-prolyl cis-trans isomerase C
MKIIVTLLSYITFAVSSFAFAQEKSDKVAVEYQGGTLTYNDIEKKMEALWGLDNTSHKIDLTELSNEDKKNLIRHIIISDSLISKAKKQNIQNLPSYKSQSKKNDTELLQQIFLQQLAEKEVTEDKIKAKYQEMINSKAQKEEIKASHILVDTEGEAKQLLIIIKQNKKSFAEIAMEFSKDPGSKALGGELGYFSRGQMTKPFEDAAFNLEINQISNPVKSSFGWHIIKLHDRRKVNLPEYNVEKEKIKADLESEFVHNFIHEIVQDANIKFKF